MRPICSSCTFTVVSGGLLASQNRVSSKPMTEISSGTAIPQRCRCRRMPKATMSFTAAIAVGRTGMDHVHEFRDLVVVDAGDVDLSGVVPRLGVDGAGIGRGVRGELQRDVKIRIPQDGGDHLVFLGGDHGDGIVSEYGERHFRQVRGVEEKAVVFAVGIGGEVDDAGDELAGLAAILYVIAQGQHVVGQLAARAAAEQAVFLSGQSDQLLRLRVFGGDGLIEKDGHTRFDEGAGVLRVHGVAPRGAIMASTLPKNSAGSSAMKSTFAVSATCRAESGSGP